MADSTDVPLHAKAFVPLGERQEAPLTRSLLTQAPENNPEVMSALVHKLGLSQSLSFHDVFSIDDPDLLAFVPRPATALLLVFPVSKSFEKFRAEEDADKPAYDGKGQEEEVLWYRQTIRNACGLMGLLHAVSNGGAKSFIGSCKA
jgi:ubiquitin carboxyl-terminal hydrolase L3